MLKRIFAVFIAVLFVFGFSYAIPQSDKHPNRMHKYRIFTISKYAKYKYEYSCVVPQSDTDSNRTYKYGIYTIPRYGRYKYGSYLRYTPGLNYNYKTYGTLPFYYSQNQQSSKVREK
jgi:hypothetical protein